MKKKFLTAGLAAIISLGLSAQTTEQAQPPKPPKAPTPHIESIKEIPPPPPPPVNPPPPPQPPQPPKITSEATGHLQDDYQAFLNHNPDVKSLGWNKKNEVIVHLKSGKEEKYNLNDEKSRKDMEAKYGRLPVAPPPPPPPPPMPPKMKSKKTTV